MHTCIHTCYMSSKNLYWSITRYADLKILRGAMFGVIHKLTWLSYFLSYKNLEKLASYTVTSLAPLYRIPLSRFFFLFYSFYQLWIPFVFSVDIETLETVVQWLDLEMLFMDMVVVFLRRDSFHSLLDIWDYFIAFQSFDVSFSLIIDIYYLDCINITNNKRKNL